MDYQLSREQFHELRKELGLTQKQVAEQFRVSPQTVMVWEGRSGSNTKRVEKPNYMACMLLTHYALGDITPNGWKPRNLNDIPTVLADHDPTWGVTSMAQLYDQLAAMQRRSFVLDNSIRNLTSVVHHMKMSGVPLGREPGEDDEIDGEVEE